MPQGQPPSPAPLGDAKGRLILSLLAASKAFERQGQPGGGGGGQRPEMERRYAHAQNVGGAWPGKAFIVVSGLQHVMPGIKVRASRVSMDTHRAGLEQVAAGGAPASTVLLVKAAAQTR